jgi:hypothetical protein
LNQSTYNCCTLWDQEIQSQAIDINRYPVLVMPLSCDHSMDVCHRIIQVLTINTTLPFPYHMTLTPPLIQPTSSMLAQTESPTSNSEMAIIEMCQCNFEML